LLGLFRGMHRFGRPEAELGKAFPALIKANEVSFAVE
jgi:hypothetical protein